MYVCASVRTRADALDVCMHIIILGVYNMILHICVYIVRICVCVRVVCSLVYGVSVFILCPIV